MNLLRVRIDHGDILTFMMGQCGGTMDDCLWVNGCHVMVRKVIRAD